MAYFMLMQNYSAFNTPSKAYMKSFVMMIGEFEYEDMYGDACDDQPGGLCKRDRLFYQILLLLFCLTMTTVLTNMLIGLATGNIREIQEKSEKMLYETRIPHIVRGSYDIEWLSSIIPKKLKSLWNVSSCRTPNDQNKSIEIRYCSGDEGIFKLLFYVFGYSKSYQTTIKMV